MDLTNYITQSIPNMKEPFEDVSQEVIIISIKVDWQRIAKEVVGLPQIIVEYEILKTKNGKDVSDQLRNSIKPKVFDNNLKVYQRSFEQETLFQPIPNPDFVEGESPEDERFLTIGSFDFIVGEIVMKNPQYLVPFMKMYIIDNAEDGWYDSTI